MAERNERLGRRSGWLFLLILIVAAFAVAPVWGAALEDGAARKTASE
jgi:hypothetical protein